MVNLILFGLAVTAIVMPLYHEEVRDWLDNKFTRKKKGDDNETQ